MRRFLSTIFIVSFCSHASWAAITCTTSATTECEAGCRISDIYGCIACEDGKYSSIGANSSCVACFSPQDTEDLTFTSPGTSATGCSWTAICPAGKQYTNTNTNQSGCKKCADGTFSPEEMKISGTGYGKDQPCNQECGANSHTNNDGTGCICNTGYHTNGASNEDISNNNEDCVANTYTITYHPNGGTGNKQTEPVSFGATITLKNSGTFSRRGYTLTGWQVQNTTTVYDLNTTIEYKYADDITLLAQWTGKKFTITYNTGDANCPNITPQECQFGNTSTCNAPDTENCSYPGHIFTGWKCTGCDNGSSDIIKPDTDIFNLSSGQDITLTAIWEQCTAGYYCTNTTTKYPCPAGSTSDAGTSEKQKCYMAGGETKFCDQYGKCFTLPLPTGQKIYYKTNQ